MNSLDLAVSSAMMRLRALERALHDDGPWEMEYAGIRTLASRTVTDDRVQFSARFPSPWPKARSLTLLCADEPVLVKPFAVPYDDGEFIADWALRLHTPVEV